MLALARNSCSRSKGLATSCRHNRFISAWSKMGESKVHCSISDQAIILRNSCKYHSYIFCRFQGERLNGSYYCIRSFSGCATRINHCIRSGHQGCFYFVNVGNVAIYITLATSTMSQLCRLLGNVSTGVCQSSLKYRSRSSIISLYTSIQVKLTISKEVKNITPGLIFH